jgi:hypothetical protein
MKQDITKTNVSLLLIFLITLLIPLSSALTITPFPTNPANGSTINSKNVSLGWNINSTNNILNFTLFWNNTNIDLYDQLLLYYNFNNVSDLGENSSYVIDLSKYSANGTFRNTTSTYVVGNGKYYNSLFVTGLGGSSARINVDDNSDYPQYGLDNHSISAWVYITETSSSKNIFMQTYGSKNRFFNIDGTTLGYLDTSNSTDYKRISCYDNKVPVNTWTHVVVSFQFNSSFKLYINNRECNTYTNTIQWHLYSNVFNRTISNSFITNSYVFNGSIDDVMLFNKSLSQLEVNALYYTSLNKFSNTNYTLLINDYNVSTQKNYNLNLYINDTSSILVYNYNLYNNFLKTLSINFNSLIGKIRDVFYGTNTHVRDLSKGSRIDTNGDITLDTDSNITWHREMWLNAKLDNMRGDMYLTNYYQGIGINGGVDRIINPVNVSHININGSSGTCNEIALGWCFSTWNATGNYGHIMSASNDSYSGKYSINITNNRTFPASIAFTYWTITNPELNVMYNFTARIKTDDYITFKGGFNGGSISACAGSRQGDGDWMYFNCNVTVADSYTDIRFDVNADYNESFLIDDVRFYKNNEIFTYHNHRLLENQTDLVDWSTQNNITILYIADRPSHSYVIGSRCKDNEINYCLGEINYTEWYAPVIKDFIRQVTRNLTNKNTVEIEIMNEPYFYDDWYANISNYAEAGGPEYVRAYNATWYHLKSWEPSLIIGGPSGFRSASNLSKTFISNLTNQFDFISIHPYYSDYIRYNLSNDIKQILDFCDNYSANCSRIYINEWNSNGNWGGYNILNTSSLQYRLNVSTVFAYMDILNNYPSIVTSQNYQWHEKYSYAYADYPDNGIKYAMLSEPNQDNYISSVYQITKDFATYCPAGGQVVQSSSDYSGLKVVACKEDIGELNRVNYNLILINTDSDSINVSLSTNDFISNLTKATTGITYSTNNLGVIQPNEYLIYSFQYRETDIETLNTICNEAGLSFLDAVKLVGLIFTVILLITAVGIFISVGAGYFSLDDLKFEGISIKALAGIVMIIAVTFFIIATMAFIINGAFCTAITAG